MSRKVVIATYDAAGGPATKAKGTDGFQMGPTDPGTYVIAYCGKHRSSRYPDWSGVPWGTPLRENGSEIEVQLDGKWKKLSTISRLSKAEIVDMYKTLYGTAKLPATWVFNDFGHLTCYMFKDKNNNRKLDAKLGEKIHGEFFHTTPPDEAATALGQPVTLSESHGCIHVKPTQIDEMIKKGYMKRGNTVVVHKYTDKVIGFSKASKGTAPFELHFYPALAMLAVVGAAGR